MTSSPQVTAAILQEITGWTQLTAQQTGHLPGMAATMAWLGRAADAGHAARSTTSAIADPALLRAVPSATAPQALPVRPGEAEPVLYAGVAASAERLRNASYAQPDLISADTLQYTATAARIACHLTSVITRHLLEDRAIPAPASDSAIRASRAWQQVASTWRSFRTDTPPAPAPVVSDAGDLVIRLGRLAFDDPSWIPARGARLPPRNPQQARSVLAAVHQTADALARMAATDLTALAATVTAGRLYAITEAPASSEPAHARYGKAGGHDSQQLHDAYQAAIVATSDLASRMDHIATTHRCHTTALARARLAAPVSQDINWPVHLIAEDTNTIPEPASSDERGPLEQQIKLMGIRDPSLLRRAQEIDRAAQDVLRQATERTSHPPPRTRRHRGTDFSR